MERSIPLARILSVVYVSAALGAIFRRRRRREVPARGAERGRPPLLLR
jgi:hypothetical protein